VAVGMLAHEASIAVAIPERRMPAQPGLEWMEHRDHQMTAGPEHASQRRGAGAEIGQMRERQSANDHVELLGRLRESRSGPKIGDQGPHRGLFELDDLVVRVVVTI
jgi:hypothetical protein